MAAGMSTCERKSFSAKAWFRITPFYLPNQKLLSRFLMVCKLKVFFKSQEVHKNIAFVTIGSCMEAQNHLDWKIIKSNHYSTMYFP